jgi:sugar lactone lactonase YvrE
MLQLAVSVIMSAALWCVIALLPPNLKAATSRLAGPSGLAVDNFGNVYVSDTYNHRIIRIGSTGEIATLAGTGKKGYRGDGGEASLGQLNTPTGLSVDTQSNVYFADTGSHVIRQITRDGRIVTVAGSGEKGFGGDGGKATAALFTRPFDVEIDANGAIYIADTDNFRVRKVTPDGVITTILKLDSTPYALTLDQRGNLYISQWQRVLRLAPDGLVTVAAGTGTLGDTGDGSKAVDAQLSNVLGLAVDADDNVYLADQNNRRIRKIDQLGMLTQVWRHPASATAIPAGSLKPRLIAWPTGIAVDKDGNVYFASTDVSEWGGTFKPTSNTGISGASINVILGAMSNAQAGVIYGKDVSYLPRGINKWILKLNYQGGVSNVLGE